MAAAHKGVAMAPEDYFEWNLFCLRTLGFGLFVAPKLATPVKTQYDFFYSGENFSVEYVLRHIPAIAVMMWVPGSELWGFIECFGNTELMVKSLMFLIYESIMLTKFVWYFLRGKNMRLLAYLIEVETKNYYQDWTLVRRAIKLTRRILIGGYTLVLMTVGTGCLESIKFGGDQGVPHHNTNGGYTLVLMTVGTGCLESIKFGGDQGVPHHNTNESLPPHDRAIDLPFIMPMPFSVEKDTLFALGFILQAVPLFCYGLMFFAADLFIFSCMIHLATQFHVLQKALADVDQHAIRDLLGESAMEKMGPQDIDTALTGNESRLQPHLEHRLLRCVKHHQLLLMCCELLETTYSPGFFAHFLNGIVSVVLGIIAMNANTAMDLGKLMVLFYLSTTLLNLATLCYAGNEVTYQSLAVGGAVLHSRWYVAGAHWRRSAVLLTLRAQRPVYLTAGKFIILSLGSFLKTLKAAYSYNVMLSRTSSLN